MKLKNVTIGSEKIKKRGKRFYIAILIPILLVLVGVGVFIAVKKSDSNNALSPVECNELVDQTGKVNSGDKPVGGAALRTQYDNSKDSLSGCQSTVKKTESKLDTLKFNYEAAITAFKFGDTDKANSYADTALALNQQVDDGSRGDSLVGAEELKVQMEAVKNGNY